MPATSVPMFAYVNDTSWGHVLEQFEKEVLLGPWVTFIHCLGLEDAAWRAIERTGGKVSVSASAEQSLAIRQPALQTALEHGIPTSSGTDTVGIAPVDFFSQMRAAIRSRIHAARQSDSPEVPPITVRNILRMATLGGAQGAHLDHLVVTPGKRADVIALNGRTLNAGPVNHAPGAVVQHMDTSNVDTVIVDGRVVKRDGRRVGVDVEAVLQQLERSAAGLVSRSRATNILFTGCRQQ
ncbi:amidohydrolase family protein [Nocardia araoensis]|uniref:amidohydrolase family protein n=1 Tax=Nocardia araoensis TaxID=228600 RepID=UPI000317CEAB|nr:amidohydrolase family protein [Nocardia araoensis]